MFPFRWLGWSAFGGTLALAFAGAWADGGDADGGADDEGDAAGPKVVWNGTGDARKCAVEKVPVELLAAAKDWDVETWRDHFSVHTVVGEEVTPTCLWGDYGIREQSFEFVPRYPLQAGVTYEVRVKWGNGPGTAPRVWRTRWMVPPVSSKPTRLTAIYPTRPDLPENLLKFYLHFSAPMSRGEVYRRVRLLDEAGRRVELPFLELSQELWSPDGRRLTLYFDPGRIKRGLKPREFLGPALLAGKSYSLIVDSAWPDATGRPLDSGGAKSFRVLEPDDVQPSPNRWRLEPPAARTTKPLRIQFDESLDSAMLVRVLAVRNESGREIPGEIELGRDEQEWNFVPAEPWRGGRYQLVVATTLEDLAGNSIGRPFEVDVFRPADPRVETETENIPFHIVEGAN